MRRWNGWGEAGIDYPMPDGAPEFLAARLGPGSELSDCSLEEVLAGVPASRLPFISEQIKTDTFSRLTHSLGQSLPDWVAMRSGDIPAFTDGVAYPQSEAEVRALIAACYRQGVTLIPYGGGTSVVGHINPLPGERPILTLDLSRLNKLAALDEHSGLATFGCGANGPQIEAALHPRGYTLGHFPQSFEYSTLGGWIATRSCGQQSYYYGRIEDLFVSGHLETPAGPLDFPAHPASAAGPDLRHLALGSEGRLGVITHAQVKIRRLPEVDAFAAIIFPNWDSGLAALHKMAQERVRASLLRLSDEAETETTFALAGRPGEKRVRASGVWPYALPVDLWSHREAERHSPSQITNPRACPPVRWASTGRLYRGDVAQEPVPLPIFAQHLMGARLRPRHAGNRRDLG